MDKQNQKPERTAREKLRRGRRALLIVVIALPLCFLLSLGKQRAGQHMEPGYTMEVSGRWDLAGSFVLGPTAADGGTVSAAVEEERLVYDFGGARVSVETKTPRESYYVGDRLELEFPMEREADAEQTPGDVACMFYLADDVQKSENGAEGAVRAPLKYAYSGEADMEPISYETALTRRDRRYAVANTPLPEGQADREALYLVMDVTDDQGAGVRTVMAWKYVWTQGPLTVEVPPRETVIEYYREYSALNLVFRALTVALLIAAPVLLVRQLVLRKRAKKEQA